MQLVANKKSIWDYMNT